MEQLNMQVNCSNVATHGDTTTATLYGKISGPTKEYSTSIVMTATYVGTPCPFVEGNAYQLVASDAE